MPLNPTNPRRMSVTPATIQMRVPAASPINGTDSAALVSSPPAHPGKKQVKIKLTL